MHQLRLLLFLLPALLPAQDFFERYYDSGGAESGSAIAVAGNNIVLAGRTDFNAVDRANGVLHALDLNGNLRYTATIAADHRTNFTALTTVQLNGAPGIIAGAWANVEQTSDNLTFYGLNIAGEGNAFGWGDPVDDEQARSLFTLANGDVLAVGNVGNTNNGLIFRFTPDGTVRWRRTFAIPGTRYNVFHEAREVPDGIILVGYSTVEEVDGQTILVKVSPQGDLIWSYRYDYASEADARFRTLQVLPNGELIVTSHVVNDQNSGDILFLRLNADGEVISKSLLGGAGRDGVQAVIQTSRGTLLLAGATSSTILGRANAMVLEVDRDGQILRQRTLATYQNSRINSLVAAPAGGYYLAGTADYCRDQSDMLLVYLNDTLENPLESCVSTPINLSRKPAGPITRVAIGSMADRTEPQVVPFALEARPVNINDNNCPELDLDADNSSGAAEPNGFTFPDTCYNGPLPIMDIDAAFTVQQPMFASVRISFRPLQEGESLVFPPEIAGQLESIGLNDYSFYNAQNLPADQVVALLKQIRYRNDNAVIVEGIREIDLQTFFLCQTGNLSITRFYLRASGPFSPDLPDAVLCPGEDLFVDATAAGATDYVWGDGAQGARRRIEEPGMYVVTISNACSATIDTLVVTAGEDLGPLPQLRDQALCPGDSVSLNATTAGAFAYQWSDGAELPVRTLQTPEDYALTISNGCREEVLAFTLSGQSCCQLYVPNAFSPNGDGINDVFRAFPDPALCAPVTDYQFRVFNRWGGEVYYGQQLTTGWDGMVAGRPAGPGHYVYVITYDDGFQRVELSGGVVLLR